MMCRMRLMNDKTDMIHQIDRCINAAVLFNVIIGCLTSLAFVCLTFNIYFVPGYKNWHVCERNKETLHR